MKNLIYLSFLVTSLWISSNGYSQGLTNKQKEKISSEITTLFEKSVKAGERFDIKEMTSNVDDSLRAGFIDNGYFFNSFEEVMKGFKERIKGCKSQKTNISNKKITVLSDNVVLLTTSGDYLVALEDGRTLTDRFAWTFVYSKINDTWKVVHSHMSNPK